MELADLPRQPYLVSVLSQKGLMNIMVFINLNFKNQPPTPTNNLTRNSVNELDRAVQALVWQCNTTEGTTALMVCVLFI